MFDVKLIARLVRPNSNEKEPVIRDKGILLWVRDKSGPLRCEMKNKEFFFPLSFGQVWSEILVWVSFDQPKRGLASRMKTTLLS